MIDFTSRSCERLTVLVGKWVNVLMLKPKINKAIISVVLYQGLEVIKSFLFIFAFLFSTQIFAEDCIHCTPTQNEIKAPGAGVERLASLVEKSLKTYYVKVAELKVNHAGAGDLSVMVDEAGNVLAVKFYYKNGKDEKNFTVSVEDFNKGKGIEYPALKAGVVSPLRLTAVNPPGINGANGGNFKLTIATSLDPVKTQDSIVSLKKSNGKWLTETNNKEMKKVTLSPGISWMAWDGTFEEVAFE